MMDSLIPEEERDRSSSSEPLIESYQRSKRLYSTDQEVDDPKRQKLSNQKGWLVNYLQELNNTILICTDSKPEYPRGDPESLQVGASAWDQEERDTLYRALRRCGRDDILQISQCLQTKSELEVEAFLQILERASDETAVYQRGMYLKLEDTPAALEVDPDLDESLEKVADIVGLLQSKREAEDLQKRYGQLWLLGESTLSLIESNDFDIGEYVAPSDPIAQDAAAALDLFYLAEFLKLSSKVFMNSQDPQQNYTTFAQKEETPSIRLTAAVDFYRIVKTLTVQIVLTAQHCAHTRIRDNGKDLVPELLECDIDAALEILRQSSRQLQYKGREHRVSMLRRNNVQAWARVDGSHRPKPVSIDNAEWWLRRNFRTRPDRRMAEERPNEPRSSARADLERVCSTDLKGLNQVEKLKARDMQALFDDHEPYVINPGETQEIEDAHPDPDLLPNEEVEHAFKKEDKEANAEEDYVAVLDAIAAQEDADWLRKSCTDHIAAETQSRPFPTPAIRKFGYRRFRTKRHDWRQELDYKPEWERYHEPVDLQILKGTIVNNAPEPDSDAAADEQDDAALAVSERSQNDMQKQGPQPESQSDHEMTDLGERTQDADDHMEGMRTNSISPTASSRSSSTESSSEVSTSSEE